MVVIGMEMNLYQFVIMIPYLELISHQNIGVQHISPAAMASIPPGDIQTQPSSKIVFNAPYDDKHTYHIKIINTSARRIGWAIKTTNMKRLGVDPPCGVLDPKEATLMAVSCDTFVYGQDCTHVSYIFGLLNRTVAGRKQ
uniref:Major sperm protein n=1 Tax=Heterorhabditis bacteriophora TaxID=37862 RepID=A0A1I7X4J3_HETBA